MKKCPNCGALAGDSAVKCNSCDRPFPEPTEETAPVLELGSDEYVAPPVFPEDSSDAPVPELVLPEEPAAEPEAAKKPAPAASSDPAAEPAPEPSPSPDPHINLTQQAIHEQRQRQSYNSSAFSDQASCRPGASEVTGTTALILGIIGLVLVVVFGGIGSCTGVAGFSLSLTVIGLICSIIGLVKAGNDRKLSGGTCERANAAFIVSLIGLILGAVLLIIGICIVGCVGCLACTAAGVILP